MTQKQVTTTIRDFATIQKRAACLISGAFRTTAAEALNIELHLLPIRQQLEQLTKMTAIRIRTGPAHGIPSGMLTKRTDEELTLGGYTPMEAHAWKTGGCLTAPPRTLAGQWESREAYVQAPWHEPPKIIIDEREKAISAHNSILKDNTHTMVYTDGSGYQGYIGAAAVIPAMNVQITECIGTESTSTVYTGESCGIKFALKSLIRLQRDRTIKKPVIFSDSQAALKTLRNPRMVSGQEYIRDCVHLLSECTDMGIDVTLRWIPGHEGVPGNEAADRAAKRAALTGVRREIVPGDISHWVMLGAAAKRRIRQSAKDAWERSWNKQKSGKPTKKLVTRPSKRTLQYWTYLRKATSSILIQLRTERIGLAHYLWRINKRDSPYCTCGLSGQTARHILMECPLYTEERDQMWARIKGFRRTTDLQALLNEKSAAVAIAEFMLNTRVLEQFRETDPQAIGTYDNAETDQHDEGTGVRTNSNAREDDARSRSASSSVRTSNTTNTSLGSGTLERVDGDVQSDESESVSVQIGEDSFAGDDETGAPIGAPIGGRYGARTRAIDLWD
jgi:ribonuclease HI